MLNVKISVLLPSNNNFDLGCCFFSCEEKGYSLKKCDLRCQWLNNRLFSNS